MTVKTSRAAQATIDLCACRHNLAIAKKASPASRCFAIIKANAYGHGMEKIAHALTEADAFGVATVNEALQLRESGINKAILLLEGFTSLDELSLAREFNLECVIHHESQLQLLEQDKGEALKLVVKIDSGMHRLGFAAAEVSPVIQRITKMNHKLKLMTHLANADDKHDDKTIRQLETFYQSIENYTDLEISIANSAGILGWPQTHAEWNRPGILLYGVSPFLHDTAETHQLKPVMTLSSQLISVKKLKQGDTIGYGGTYTCDKDMTVGVVAIGYGDGYPRHAKTGTPVLVNNKVCTLLGRVSMDMICVDLSEQPDAKVNDTVVLWGNGLAVEQIAESAETIAYELLCGVTNRVEFIYRD
ncbi:MAG: alanine racemase [Gammaproteobacteria bacterium]|nr:alanine racemase [Gammaproteobacteria bacterium]